jgi:hypothetical protein
MAIAVEGFCNARTYFVADSIAGFVHFYAQLAAELYVSYRYKLVDLCRGSVWRLSYNLIDGELPKHKGSACKSREEPQK